MNFGLKLVFKSEKLVKNSKNPGFYLFLVNFFEEIGFYIKKIDSKLEFLVFDLFLVHFMDFFWWPRKLSV